MEKMMKNEVFYAVPDLLKLLGSSTIRNTLKDTNKLIDFKELRKLVNEYLDELEKDDF